MAVIEVTLRLSAPIAVHNYCMTGDALLFAAQVRKLYPDAARRTPDMWKPISLPVRRYESDEGGFWGVSSLFCDREPVVTEETWRKGSDARVIGEQEQSIGKLRMGNVALCLWTVPSVRFYVETDQAQGAELLSLIRGYLPSLAVGKKANRGMGGVCGVNARLTQRTSAIREGGHPLRPLPLSFAEVHEIGGWKTAARLEPPYFEGQKVMCVVASMDPIWRWEAETA